MSWIALDPRARGIVLGKSKPLMSRQQRAVQTREAVVIAAARQFARAGYRGTTLNAIAREAQATQGGALYFHFDSKQQLAAEVISRQHAISISAGKRHLAGATSGLAGIVQLSGELAHEIVTDPIVEAGMRLSTESADELADIARAPYGGDWIATSRQFLQIAADLGEIRLGGTDLDAAAETLVAAFTGAQSISAALSGSSDLIARLERMWPTLLAGIAHARDHPPAVTDVHELLSSAIRHTSEPKAIEDGSREEL